MCHCSRQCVVKAFSRPLRQISSQTIYIALHYYTHLWFVVAVAAAGLLHCLVVAVLVAVVLRPVEAEVESLIVFGLRLVFVVAVKQLEADVVAKDETVVVVAAAAVLGNWN